MTADIETTHRTIDDLAAGLKMSKRGAMSLLETYTTYCPIRTHQGVRRQTWIHTEDVQTIVRQYEEARALSLSLDTWLRLQTEHGATLPGSWKPSMGDVQVRVTELSGKLQEIREDVAQMTRQLEELTRNQAHLLRVVSPLVRERGGEGVTSPTSVVRSLDGGIGTRVTTPAPAPAPAPVRAEGES